MTAPTAARAGLVSCHICSRLTRVVRRNRGVQSGPSHCPTCHSSLHGRKPYSIQRTWALLLASAVLYVPANIYSVMTTEKMGEITPNTIIQGVHRLLASGQILLALLVFFASIVVPALKILGLSFLLFSVHRRWKWRLRERTRLYRIIEVVGRWSMLDIFVISLLIALVQLGAITTVTPDPGVLPFGALVVLTMLASMSFDPRLMWDRAGAGP